MILLLLMGLGAAGVKAQVRIGGNGAPNAAAVLDLNANDDATPVTNKGALALPRVSLASTTAHLNGVPPITGMLVYNTNASISGSSGAGIYYWDGLRWTPLASASNSPALFSFKLVLDTTITYTNPNTGLYWMTFKSTTTSLGDFCFGAGIMTGGPGVIYQVAYGAGVGTGIYRIQCLRPVQ